jgi:transglutaminase-like putative cysteine protease
MKTKLTRLLVLLSILAPAAHVAGQGTDKEAKALVAKALEAAKAKDLDQAISLATKAIQLTPGNDQLFGLLSELEFKAGKFADGLAHAQKAIALKPSVGEYYFLAGMNAYATQDLEKCREYCKKILDQPDKFSPGTVVQTRFLEDCVVDKTFTLFFKLDPKKGTLVNGVFPLALPKSGLPYQKSSYEISGVRSHRVVRGKADDILYVTPKGTEPFSLTIKVTVKPYPFKDALAKAVPGTFPTDARANLGAMVAINPKSAALQKVIRGLKGKGSVATVRNIQDWLKKNIEYKLEKSTLLDVDFKSVDEIIERGSAECRGYTMLFTALCRAAGIPARPVWGLFRVPPGVERKYGDIVSHSWAEFYVSGCGWVPIDPQRPETLGFLPNNYLRMFTAAHKSVSSTESFPLFNLLLMHDAKIRYQETR